MQDIGIGGIICKTLALVVLYAIHWQSMCIAPVLLMSKHRSFMARKCSGSWCMSRIHTYIYIGIGTIYIYMAPFFTGMNSRVVTFGHVS